MKKAFFPLVCSLAFLFYACSSSPEQNEGPSETLTSAKGGRYYGGVFKLNESEYIKSLFPPNIIDTYSFRVATQIYEGLFKFTQDSLKVIPSLVSEYSIDETNTVYTFKLKDNVFFHDDECFPGGKGRKLVADDIAYCFGLLCTQSNDNQSFNLVQGIVKGAEEHFEATAKGEKPNGVSGIKVIDDTTIEITLVRPNSMFLYNLARPGAFIFPKEAYQTYREEMRIKTVGTGPFRLQSVDEDIQIVLRKNENYHSQDEFGNQLPFLDAVSIRFLKDKKVELLEFKKGNLDMMYRLPTDYIIEIIAEAEANDKNGISEFQLDRKPEMSSQILSFLNSKGVFKDVNVRKAFSYAIDKNKILDYVLNGEGYGPGHYGITPPAFGERYDIYKIDGYSLNLDSARYYLRKAGFPNGEGFPRVYLDLNSEGERYTNVAIEVQKQLKDNLGIELELNVFPMAQIAEKARGGDYEIIRLAWVADYPSPENYLWMFYGANLPEDPSDKSWPNLARYQNDTFDQLYESALAATDEAEAFKLFMEAEKVAMQDAPILVLWYDEGYRLMQSNIKNFPMNPMQYRDFSAVYFTKKKEPVAASNNQ